MWMVREKMSNRNTVVQNQQKGVCERTAYILSSI
jgi:hypothetical protein